MMGLPEIHPGGAGSDIPARPALRFLWANPREGIITIIPPTTTATT